MAVDLLTNLLAQSPAAVAGSLVVAFLMGSIPFGLLLALAFGKTDIRTAGSGNIGATNVARVAGRKLGIVTLFLDALKGGLPVIAVQYLWPVTTSPQTLILHGGLVGLMALLGHCFTPWLRFKGGKGVATGLGVLLALHPEVAGYALAAFAVAFVASRLVSASSLSAAVVVVIALIVRGPLDLALVPMLSCLVVIVVRHRDNMRRMARKEELSV